MTLGSYFTSLFLRGKWAVDGIQLIRLLVIMMWSYPFLALDSCQGVTQPLLNTLADRKLTRWRGNPGPLWPTWLILTGSESRLWCSPIGVFITLKGHLRGLCQTLGINCQHQQPLPPPLSRVTWRSPLVLMLEKQILLRQEHPLTPGLGDLTLGYPPWLSVLNLGYTFEDQWDQLIFIPFPTFSLFLKPQEFSEPLSNRTLFQRANQLGLPSGLGSPRLCSCSGQQRTLCSMSSCTPRLMGHCWELGIQGWSRPTRSSLLL